MSVYVDLSNYICINIFRERERTQMCWNINKCDIWVKDIWELCVLLLQLFQNFEIISRYVILQRHCLWLKWTTSDAGSNRGETRNEDEHLSITEFEKESMREKNF